MWFTAMVTVVMKGLQALRSVSSLVKFSVIELNMTKEAFTDMKRLKSGLKGGKGPISVENNLI